jgi:hypothetical protein
MKNLLFFVFKSFAVLAVLSGLAGCTFSDPDLTYPYTSVLFTYQDYNRNVVVGEGLNLNAGIVLAGILDNKENRIVNYEIDPSLLDGTDKSLLPASYYKLGHPSQIVIPKGDLKGYLPVVLDSMAFLSDPKSLTGEYVLPIRLVSCAGVDVILEEKSSVRMSISYFGKQYGFYYYSGDFDKIMDGVAYVSSSYSYVRTDNESKRFIQTVSATGFRMVADAKNLNDPMNILSADGRTVEKSISFLIDVPTFGTSVTITADPNSPFEVHPDGTSTYDPDRRTFHLKYTWLLPDGTVCKVTEDLVFRNRIRDDQGNDIYINEWW